MYLGKALIWIYHRWFRIKYATLDFLVNNAGIVYLPNQPFNPEDPPTSKQGYDAAFATNYLGHFLLAELLLPVLKNTSQSRMLSVASSAHLTVSGQDLLCSGNCGPKCALPVKTSAAYFGAYGNNKMAQMMHIRHLQAEINAEGSGANGLKVIVNMASRTSLHFTDAILLSSGGLHLPWIHSNRHGSEDTPRKFPQEDIFRCAASHLGPTLRPIER
jgi:NAD(P)-dependent dehydrogenase (short-subunit alcohol dehydrogenase family)